MILVMLLVLFASLVIGTTIAASLGLTAITYFLASGGTKMFFLVPQRFFAGCNSFELIAIPLFILSGDIMLEGEISKALVNLAKSLVGWIRGSLALVGSFGMHVLWGCFGVRTSDNFCHRVNCGGRDERRKLPQTLRFCGFGLLRTTGDTYSSEYSYGGIWCCNQYVDLKDAYGGYWPWDIVRSSVYGL